ncbi:hypothetical protein BK129_14700 [Paenibacillus amylolyticus]|uniref:hypothetical protein n=1 Tax=Paenibacillus amylolyticus TaxID=1451 RepID=UPI00096FBBEF|nr:hypothetical protein [Paenibacillus amylolyticus]OMF05234.1 hypothetical protein BK129_14700 [Paenibacillus amylolyticus]
MRLRPLTKEGYTTDSLITTAVIRFKLFKQPYKVGQTVEVRGEPMLVLGIENFEIFSEMILVRYTCQRLNQMEFVSKAKAYREPSSNIEMVIEIPHKEWKETVPGIRLGSIHSIKGEIYKVTEYTGIALKSTDLVIDMLARPVYPVDRNTAKSKLLDERRKKLKLEIV